VIERLTRYPVKSMLGERLEDARVTERGIEGDRRWAVIDEESGLVVSAKYPRKWRNMLLISARYVESDPGHVVVRLPDGQQARSDDAACADLLSRYLGRCVRLADRPPSAAAIERTDPDVEAETVTGLPAEAARTSLLGRGPAGTSFFDYAPIHLVTAAMLRRLSELAPESCFDPARFRPNFVLDLPDTEPFAENEWGGRLLQIGDEVVIRILLPSPRCSIPTLAQPGLPLDHGIIRAIARHNRISIDGVAGRSACAGAYAEVVTPGMIQVGDRVSWLAPGIDRC
jgi:uncharacterized protein YcbX